MSLPWQVGGSGAERGRAFQEREQQVLRHRGGTHVQGEQRGGCRGIQDTAVPASKASRDQVTKALAWPAPGLGFACG